MHGRINAVPCEVYGDLDRVVRPDLHYHYSSPICAHRWLDVCEDPAYGHGWLVNQVDEIFPKLMDALRADSNTLSRISLTSLGPGDGALDERMLRSLDAETHLVSYCGLDFSFELLRRAVHRIAHAQGFRRAFPIRAVCGDFRDLSGAVMGDPPDECVRMFSLTGFTLGNYRECDLLERIGRLMRDGDYLFLDARLHTLGPWPDERRITDAERTATLGSYDLPAVRKFVFGPAEVATFASAEDVDIDFEVTRTLTVVPNAVNVVIYCTGLDTRMRLTGEPVQRDRLDLAVTTMYHYPDLVLWFGSGGFSTVWHEDVSGTAMFLLRRN